MIASLIALIENLSPPEHPTKLHLEAPSQLAVALKRNPGSAVIGDAPVAGHFFTEKLPAFFLIASEK